MNRRTANFRRKASLRVTKRLVGVALLGAAACVAMLAMLLGTDEVRVARASVSGTAVPSPGTPSLSLPAQTPAPATVARRVYRYSIIPGGVSGRDELARVIKTDQVVAAHYASFDVDKAVNVKVSKPRAVYVSYRKGDQVYWTSRKLMLVEGETLLSDGRNEMRARCANRISDEPQLPVEVNEPSAEELDSVIGVSMDLGGLGLDEPEFAAGGAINGLGAALASSEPPAASNASGAARGRVSIGHSRPGNLKEGSADRSPVALAPSQPEGAGKGGTPAVPPLAAGRPSAVLPGAPPLTPGGTAGPTPGAPPAKPGNVTPPTVESPGGGSGTPLPPRQYPAPPEWPPGTLPDLPDGEFHEIPEPDTLWLSVAALAAMLLLRRKGR